MTPTAKSILRNSINAFLVANSEDKERYISVVEKNLNDHKNAIESIGISYCIHVIQAGEIFLRIYKTPILI